ncbi:MAG: hypothetical protein IKD96_05080 [Oscillospiraceae bacterium]|nr:hypothetical protein [Oscillospiraceae bacterium]
MEEETRALTEEELTALAVRLAERPTLLRRRKPKQLRQSAEMCLRRIRTCCRLTADRAARGETVPPAAEWLLDNWYLAQREAKESLLALKGAGPVAWVQAEERPVPRAYLLAAGLVRGGENAVCQERILLFLRAVQEAEPLTERELWLFLPLLRLALTEAIAGLCGPLSAGETGAELDRRMADAFTALRLLSTMDLGQELERVSCLENLFRRDPAGIYPRMAEETRSRYRHETARLAERRRISEREAGERILQLARESEEACHVGSWIFTRPLGGAPRRRRGVCYLGGILLATLFLTLLAGFLLRSPIPALLLLIPVSDIVKNAADFLSVHIVPPRFVPRMALEDGIPPQGRTLCVVTALLTDDGRELTDRLEQYRLANRDAGPELLLGLLADLPDSRKPIGEPERRQVEACAARIEALNRRCGGGFFLFFRQPVFQDRDGRYIGWERKRGALLELARYLRRRQSGIQVLAGNAGALNDVRYLLTLDADTELTVGAARELTGAMLHPLNRPRVDRRRRVVTEGYGLLQPRISVSLEAAGGSAFARIFAGRGGIDPYGGVCSDVFCDLFDQGSYTGKGILDVDAFLACLDGRLPENRVLSHDLLEGSYLHTGLLSDVELTDGYPARVTAWYRRLHRWVRGDWQIFSWLLPRVPDGQGGRERNPLPRLCRWKIFDNLRRSLVPVLILAVLLLGLFLRGRIFAAAAIVAVVCALSQLLLSGAAMAAGRHRRERYHSSIAAGFRGAAARTAVELLLLPCHGWVCLSALLTALWRMLVSHRNLLAWVTSLQAERKKNGPLVTWLRLWPAAAAGLAVLLFSPWPAARAVGILWFFTPLLAWWLSRPDGEIKALSMGDRALLLHEAALIWRYFDDFLRPEDHWLPPDNWQEHPAVGLARRTSPTNIGMALLCVLAAADLDLLPGERALTLLGHILDTVEALPKWQGHLYNWYDTVTARPLTPRYVSTVDSGNLCGCLIALAAGLREREDGDAAALADRADRLAVGISFRPLFDERARLFRIGINAETGRPTEGWYDLLASEARQTSYIAVARGEVELRHWRRLGRALVEEDRYRGMASWTGTMFEYFMPNLLLPAYPDTLLYESLCFCAAIQRRHARGLPWGVSESAFYCFDAGMSYQYKAHGVQKLGLKRGLDSELVVAPYATYLTLAVAPVRAVRNLRRLREMGLESRYGLYEAVDFTPSRQTGGRGFEPVRTFMAHHLGMSLLAIDNALRDNIMQRRFMTDRTMWAYRVLLQEKVPVGAVVMRAPVREVPERIRRNTERTWVREGTCREPRFMVCHLLSTGSGHLYLTDRGPFRTVLNGLELYGTEGMDLWAEDGGGSKCATFEPAQAEAYRFLWRFAGNQAVYTASPEGEGIGLSLRVLLSADETGEVRELTVINRTGMPWRGAVCCFFAPVLQKKEDYDAHPAFSRLMLSTRREERGVLLLRERAQPPVCGAFLCSEPAYFETDRAALGRRSHRQAARSYVADGRFGVTLDPCILCRVPLSLETGEKAAVRFVFTAGREPEPVQAAAERLLSRPQPTGPGRLDICMRRLDLSRTEAEAALQMLPDLLFPCAASGPGEEAGQPGLWPYGISGDLPILCFLLHRREQLDRAALLIRRHRLLTLCGVSSDLVFLIREDGDYRRPLRTALEEGLRHLKLEQQLGKRGGIHLVDGDAHAVRACAALRPDEPQEAQPQPLPLAELPRFSAEEEQSLRTEWCGEYAFRFRLYGTLPPLVWTQILANDTFGTILAEAGPVHLWYENAREGMLTAWKNDPLLCRGGERWTVRDSGREMSLFAEGDGPACTVTYRPGCAVWERQRAGLTVRTTAFVPPGIPARVFLVEITGGDAPELAACIPLRMGSSDMEASHIRVAAGKDSLTAENTYHRDFRGKRLCLAASRPWTGCTGSMDSFLAGRWDGRTGGARTPCLAALWRGAGTYAVAVGMTDPGETAALAALADPDRARQALQETLDWWEGHTCALRVKTPSEPLNRFLNGWGPYQTLCCRLFARCSVYQCGGAYGFRDQLQDACALADTEPSLLREQILRCCAHQYREGDVQHWWHPEPDGPGHGVRSRCSDDLLWLPWAVCRYVEVTGDESIWEQTAPWLVSPTLAEGERTRYESPAVSEERDTVLTHALRAAERVLARGTGEHGLAPMGSGDWNDGMDRVGAGGRGESVWLTWFAAHVFRLLAERRPEEAGHLRETAETWERAAEATWAGDRYLRGFFDDGTPLGAPGASCCAMDSVAQSFAALWGQGAHGAEAIGTAASQLFDRERDTVALLTPPFDGSGPDPGYIARYPTGVRENGGQYTHAAVWLAMALFRTGDRETGWRLLRTLLPSEKDVGIYRGEPYVLAADVCTHPGLEGRAGWTWYTGSAGWMVRALREELLGIRVEQGRLMVRPRLPADWDGYEAMYRLNGRQYRITVRRRNERYEVEIM